jgi:hypothetical protein
VEILTTKPPDFVGPICISPDDTPMLSCENGQPPTASDSLDGIGKHVAQKGPGFPSHVEPRPLRSRCWQLPLARPCASCERATVEGANMQVGRVFHLGKLVWRRCTRALATSGVLENMWMI